jgi:5-methylphenazine-1-carboxylate 1-monooxygenase
MSLTAPILIIGGGIGGLTTALSLHAAGLPCRIYEAAPAILPLGVGINILPHSVRELTELGLLDQLAAVGVRTQELVYVTPHGQEVWREPRGQFAGYPWPQFSIHRGSLQLLLRDAVLARLGTEAIVTDHELVSFSQTEQAVTAQFRHKSSGLAAGAVSGSLLIAADGIHSAARAQLYPNEGPPVWSGRILWRATIDAPPFLTGASMVVAGHAKQKWVSYPIRNLSPDGSLQQINLIAELSPPESWLHQKEDWNRVGSVMDFSGDFASWDFGWMNVPDLIRQTKVVYEYPMSDREPIPQWVFGRTVLLGDAAHATYPIGSNGASQAIIDARTLAYQLATQSDWRVALANYQAERLPITNKLTLLNRQEGPDKPLQVVYERHPECFERREEVISDEELAEIAAQYKLQAGFDMQALLAKPSLSVKQ